MEKMICFGKNYPAHAEELGDIQPEKPVIFIKPPSCLASISQLHNQTLELPFKDTHHELEVVFEVQQRNKKWGFSRFTLGIDWTRRDLQTYLKKHGHPWELAKVFRNSATLCDWLPFEQFSNLKSIPFVLKINGQVRQRATSQQMLWNEEKCLALAIESLPICEHDILFTGTPTGVGPVQNGDRIEIEWGTHLQAQFYVKN